jgi:hypothetical protein
VAFHENALFVKKQGGAFRQAVGFNACRLSGPSQTRSDFTEIPLSGQSAVSILSSKVNHALHAALDRRQFSQVELSFHVFPENCENDEDKDIRPGAFSTIYPDMVG